MNLMEHFVNVAAEGLHLLLLVLALLASGASAAAASFGRLVFGGGSLLGCWLLACGRSGESESSGLGRSSSWHFC